MPALVAMPIDPVFLPQIQHNFGIGGTPRSLFKLGTLLIGDELNDNSQMFFTHIPLAVE